MGNSSLHSARSGSHWRRYPAYKDSGVSWLGEIPAHWEVKRLKRLFRVINGSTPNSGTPEFWDGDIPWVTPEDLGQLATDIISETSRQITESGYQSCGTTLVPGGSLVLSTRAPIGHLAIMKIAMCTNQGCRSLIFRSDKDGHYFYYQMLTARPELQSWGQGSTFQELSKSKLETVLLADPPLSEQRAIAAFLDRETARINALIAKKEHLIALLEEKRTALISQAVTKGLDPKVAMRDSGIEWLGEVPAHWAIAPVYARYKVQLGKMLDSSRITGEHLAPYLRNIDVQWGRVNVDDLPYMDFSIEDRKRFSLRTGDLLVCEGGEAGRAAVWCGELLECYYQKAIHRLRVRSEVDMTRFMFYLLYTAAKRGVFIAEGNPNTIDHLTAEKLRLHRFGFPPIEEQYQISAYLDREIARIDAIIAKTREHIRKLQERRTALISAMVTGKIDVHG